MTDPTQAQPVGAGSCESVRAATLAAIDHIHRLEPRLRGRGHGGYIKERDLQDGLGRYLAHAMVERASPCPIPYWDPQPGHLDVWIPDSEGLPRLVIETKLKDQDKAFECLWDLAKVAALRLLEPVECAFLVVGFTTSNWLRTDACYELLSAGRHPFAELVNDTYRDVWLEKLLPGGRGRPLRGPEALDIEVVLAAETLVWGYPCEIRALRVEPVGAWLSLPQTQQKA